ncbi:class I SAM-dependent methyltransferase [Pseudomonas sp. Marseille-QA0892]
MTDSFNQPAPIIRVESLSPIRNDAASALAHQLGFPTAGEASYALQLTDTGLQLADLSPGAPGAIRVDFIEGAAAHRRQYGGGSGQMIAKAIGIQPGVRPRVLDATAGFGRDAFVLACLGCDVILCERHPVIAALLADGLARARQDLGVATIVAHMRLIEGDAIARMSRWEEEPPQVIHLDPMFPHREKSALVKKEMRLFRPLVGDDSDAPALLEAALELASHRVVVKRPRKAPCVEGHKPGYSLDGKSSRYDIYPKKRLGS